MALEEVKHHGDKCTWHDDKGVRCNAPAVAGSEKRCACLKHLEIHRKLNQEPGA